ncbi:RNA 2',3'-cyclic phosphodiesterase [Bacillus sp. BRMEA1]|uniref:RNA 2',3'-cyclic phosphodiesterase n=1 Tax=Neobacillus endophyticus TaxID=2738405 RepID=UPI001563255D|nr:RNA 2',3'-cyclic phosphodiesterase [Neobacillus endophyticus]NRD76162.1 RNA 2',3'-cyclic phosphodiesterase [Neobacillus endophyticus]
MEQQSHYFFAVKLPEDIKQIMKSHMGTMKESIPFSRWVHYLDLHITLAFLGAATKEKLSNADNYVKQALEDVKAFTLNIDHLGFFGKEDSPRVFWAATMESLELNDIRNKVFSACEQAGFQLESRPFRPHITLARKWGRETPFHGGLLQVWEEIQSQPLSFQASEVVLYQTRVHQSPKYETLKIYPLQ